MIEHRNIPFSPPDISELEIEEVCDVLRSGWITTGKRTKELEKRLENDISRPLLAENAVEKLHNLLKRRADLYKSRSNVEICGKGSVKDVTVSVLEGIIG